jgi:hypothetical protein
MRNTIPREAIPADSSRMAVPLNITSNNRCLGPLVCPSSGKTECDDGGSPIYTGED